MGNPLLAHKRGAFGYKYGDLKKFDSAEISECNWLVTYMCRGYFGWTTTIK